MQKVDTKEFELPETLFVRDIENRVFQEIIAQCLSRISGIYPLEGNFIENILGKTTGESFKGIHIEQDNGKPSVAVKVEVNVGYGLSIPEKAEEIQTAIAEEIIKLTGLHVSSIHIIFKGIVMKRLPSGEIDKATLPSPSLLKKATFAEDYSDNF